MITTWSMLCDQLGGVKPPQPPKLPSSSTPEVFANDYENTCHFCRKEYLGRKTQKYCSTECAYKVKKKREAVRQADKRASNPPRTKCADCKCHFQSVERNKQRCASCAKRRKLEFNKKYNRQKRQAAAELRSKSCL